MYIIIVNQVAGSGRGLKIYEQLKQDMLYQKYDCRAFFTEYEGHAEKLAEQLASLHAERIKAMIVVGGDGTMHEVLNGLYHYRAVPLSFIPAGSGNDFAKGYQVTGTPSEIMRKIIIEKSSSSFWPGEYRLNDRTAKLSRLFANSIGFGFDAEIVQANHKSTYKKWLNRFHLGSLSYVVGLLDVLRSFKPKTIEVTIDGKKQKLDNVWMVTIANHSYFGGGMKIIPETKVQPHVFPVLVIRNITSWKVLLLFLTVFIGKHIKFKEVTLYHASTFHLRTKTPIYYQVDGQSGECHSCQIYKKTSSRNILGARGRKSS